MRTYIFKVAVEQDEDTWVAYSPELKDRGVQLGVRPKKKH